MNTEVNRCTVSSEPSNFEFPSVWHDNNRANVLFAPFRPKSINPVDWESKMKIWQTIVDNWCTHCKKPIFTIADLKRGFCRNGKVPVCLPEVITDLLKSKVVVHYEDLQNSLSTNDWTSWILQTFVKSPINWGWYKVRSTVAVGPDPETIAYVHLPVLERLSMELYYNVPVEYKDKLLNTDTLGKLVNMSNNPDFKLQLMWLQHKRLAQCTETADCDFVKIAKNEKHFVGITEKDLAIFTLETNENKLKGDIESLEKEKELALAQVRKYLKENMKSMAKTWLRRKQEIEKYIEKRTLALANIQTMTDQLRQLDADNLIINSYKIGVDAFKKAMELSGLNEDAVNKTMDDVANMVDVQKEIEDVLSRSLSDDWTTQDLEKELDSILADSPDDASPPNQSDFMGLPDVPFNELDHPLEKRIRALHI